MFLALLACSPTADVATGDPPPCDFGFERREDGACYEIDGDTADPTADDTGDADTDSDTDSDTDGDTDSDTDTDTDTPTDTGPWDADGDGYFASADCDDTDPALNPGAADDTDDGIDNDCDGDVDEDFDACATAYGWVDWTSGDAWGTDWVGRAGWPFEGTTTVCAVTCDVWWLTGDGIGASDACTTMEALPYDLSGSTRMCITIADPGAEAWGACDVYTSAGTLTLDVHFQG